ncbi:MULTISPECIES: erythromycin esterase family protein [unclassified Pseudoalteromonas]|uniref:erythromycin esterase family protein n=1 Tax=unclassified Pseudoalteromonas TaxID=194690 RepID=UPI000C0682DD|nr:MULTISPECIES: erythromycin esterase family protein [unclassified Pseudoalteromonas]MDP2635738.1 erythromycin esterase family protein [Pseudoalteromonas sp. 1_MG-2023]PHN91313.1 hypothetical protein CSC79_03390 [Pseudoalteromonas sp. 3D05]
MMYDDSKISWIFRVLLWCGLLFTCTVNGKAHVKIDLTDTDDFSDLTHFGDAIADKRIVYLDELTHGEHEVFALKSRLVKYLHQHHDFDALILESGLFDVNEMDKASRNTKDKRITNMAAGNIFFSYAKDPAFLDLMDYIDSQLITHNPLALSGFDGRLSGEFSLTRFVRQLEKQVKSIPVSDSLLAEWPIFSKQLQATLSRNFVSLNEMQIKQHIQTGYDYMDALNGADKAHEFDSPSYYARLLEGVIRLFEVHYSVRRFDEHDLVMANNIHWLLQNIYKNQKVIIWGHYVHVNRQGYLDSRSNNVTTALDKAYGQESYIVNFAAMSGEYREFRDGTIKKIPPINDQHLAYTFNDTFSDVPQAIFIQPKQFTTAKQHGLLLSGHEYIPASSIPVNLWRNHFDGVFLLNKVSASN